MGRFAYVNGSLVDISQASVGIADRGLLYGDGLFETVRVRGGRPVRWELHLKRMREGARILFMDDTITGLDPCPLIRRVCEANELTDARVRLTITRGVNEAAGKITAPGACPTIIVTADPLPAEPPPPARVTISSIRKDEQSPLTRVKSLNYLTSILARMEAERRGYDDAVLLNTCGRVAEGTVANLFVVRGNTLVTPSLDQGVLPGTVREAMMELAPSCGYSVEERQVRPDELLEADELFFTNAIMLIRPIAEVEGSSVGSNGFNATNRLLAALRAKEAP